MSDDKTSPKEFFLLINENGVYVKDGDFFRYQKGDTQDWGKNWERIEADSLHTARDIGIKKRRERYHKS